MSISENIASIRLKIEAAAAKTGRTGADITLVGASKMNDADKDLFTFLQYFFIQESKLAGSYYMQDNYIGGYSGMQASLPVYLTEYKLRDEQDVKDYIIHNESRGI